MTEEQAEQVMDALFHHPTWAPFASVFQMQVAMSGGGNADVVEVLDDLVRAYGEVRGVPISFPKESE